MPIEIEMVPLNNKTVLNIGAGLRPIVANDFDYVRSVYNYDPLEYQHPQDGPTEKSKKEEVEYQLMVWKFLAIAKNQDDIKYYQKRDELDRELEEPTIDLVLSISPYGYTVVDEWIDKKVKPRGYIVAIGHAGNPYMFEDKLFTQATRKKYTALNTPAPLVQQIINKVNEKYKSVKSKMEEETFLGHVMIYQKESSIERT